MPSFVKVVSDVEYNTDLPVKRPTAAAASENTADNDIAENENVDAPQQKMTDTVNEVGAPENENNDSLSSKQQSKGEDKPAVNMESQKPAGDNAVNISILMNGSGKGSGAPAKQPGVPASNGAVAKNKNGKSGVDRSDSGINVAVETSAGNGAAAEKAGTSNGDKLRKAFQQIISDKTKKDNAKDIELIELDDDYSGEECTPKKPSASTHAKSGGGTETLTNSPLPAGYKEGMVLPENHTRALLRKLRTLAIALAKEGKKNGSNNLAWQDVLSGKDLMTIAQLVPTYSRDLSNCGLQKQTIQQYEQRILEAVSTFIREEKLQRYTNKKTTTKGKDLGMDKTNGANLQNGISQQKQKQRVSRNSSQAPQATPLPTHPVNPIESNNNQANPITSYAKNNAWSVLSNAKGPNFLAQGSQPASAGNAASSTPLIHLAAGNRTVNNSAVNNSASNRSNVQMQVNSQRLPPQPANQSIANHTRNSNRTGASNGHQVNIVNVPAIERFSEYRIDKTTSVNDLESIRRRLLSLVERVNLRLKEKRLAEVVAQFTQAEDDKLQNLTVVELMEKLADEEKGFSSNEGKTNKRKSDDAESPGSGGIKRQCQSTTCPLCFEPTASLITVGTCEICNDEGICRSCYSHCGSCNRLTCLDCVACCDACGTNFHCSDCMAYGGGKCLRCRPKKKAGPSRHTHHTAATNNANMRMGNNPSSLSLANQRIGYPQPQFYPSQQQQLYSYASSTQNVQRPAPQQQSVPRPPSDLYSIHRFIISETGEVIGINITQTSKTRKCFVTTIQPDSLARRHGIQERDEILAPDGLTGEVALYDLFISSAKSRPMMFEVKRRYNPKATSNSSLSGPYSLHRFLITEPGALGLKLKKAGNSARVMSVEKSSLAEIYGLRQNDIFCTPSTNGRPLDLDAFVQSVKGSRPFTVEVLRAVSASVKTSYGSGNPNNPFAFSFPARKAAAKTGKEDATTGNSHRGQASDPPVGAKDNTKKEIILIDSDDDSVPDDEEKKGS